MSLVQTTYNFYNIKYTLHINKAIAPFEILLILVRTLDDL